MPCKWLKIMVSVTDTFFYLLFKPKWHTYPVSPIFICFYGYSISLRFSTLRYLGQLLPHLEIVIF